MALSYRAVFHAKCESAARVVEDELKAIAGEYSRCDLQSGACRFELPDDDGQHLLAVHVIPEHDPTIVVIECHHSIVAGDGEAPLPPAIVGRIVEKTSAEVGGLAIAAPLADAEIGAWLDSEGSQGQLVVAVVEGGAAPSETLLRELKQQLCGISAIGIVSVELAERLLAQVRPRPVANPGALIYVVRQAGSFEAQVLQSTAVGKNPESAVRRFRRRCLQWQLGLRLPDGATTLLRDLRNAPAGQSLDDSWFEEFERLERELAGSRDATETAWLEQDEAVRELQRVRSRLAYVEGRLREHESAPILSIPEEADEVSPNSCAEAVALARELLPNLSIRLDDRNVEALDCHEKAFVWAGKIWMALRALDSYARFKTEPGFGGNFLAFCSEQPFGSHGYSENSIAMRESESTDNNASTRGTRTFSVPESVDPVGSVYMPAHIKVDQKGSPAPRIHFFDATSTTGQIHVGYIGPHLPTGG